jgi:hypothetical protein
VAYPTCDIDGQFHRIIPSRFPPVPLYERLGSPEIQSAAEAFEALTNPRLRALDRLAQESAAAPQGSAAQNWNMAPFEYPNPEGTTFLNPAYKVLELVEGLTPALVVAVQRREDFLGGSREAAIDVEMRALVHKMKGRFADLTGIPFEADQAKRWKLGAELYDSDVQGIVFHRPDLPGVRAVTVFDQNALGRAVQADHFRFVWNGEGIQRIGNFSTHEVMDREALMASLDGQAAA